MNGRAVLLAARVESGLNKAAFAQRLNEVIGPVKWPMVPLSWHAISAWESIIEPPDYVVEAALKLSHTDPILTIDLDAA